MFTHFPSLTLFVVGIGVLVRPLVRLVRSAREKYGHLRVMGIVVKLEAVEQLAPTFEQPATWQSSTRYRPVVEFLTFTGETRQVRGWSVFQTMPFRPATSFPCAMIRTILNVPSSTRTRRGKGL